MGILLYTTIERKSAPKIDKIEKHVYTRFYDDIIPKHLYEFITPKCLKEKRTKISSRKKHL